MTEEKKNNTANAHASKQAPRSATTEKNGASSEKKPVGEESQVKKSNSSKRSWLLFSLIFALLSVGMMYVPQWGHVWKKLQLTVQTRSLFADNAWKNITVYDNGQSVGGVEVSLQKELVPSGKELAEYLSQFVTVDGIRPSTDPEAKILADRVYTGNGKLVQQFEDITTGDRLYIVAPGLLFVWPFVKLGHRVYITPEQSPTGKDIILESFTETPRVFHVYNFFSYEEADKLVERVLQIDTDADKLQQSHVGHQSGKKVVSKHRTSENAFDQTSQTSLDFKKRSFDLLAIGPHQKDMCDGVQLLRYKQKQAYIPHTDYFDQLTSSDWNWDPHEGGSNRFATIFLYLSNVTQGGQTVFPHAYMPEDTPDHLKHPENTHVLSAGSELFEADSWEYDMVEKCNTRLASYPRKAHAILFYSQKPNGELDPLSLHGGCPVLEGTKWAANLWVWNKRRYGLDQKTSDTISVKFVNPLPFEIGLYWSTTFMTKIASGQANQYNSFHDHEWTVKDVSGKVLLVQRLSKHDGENQVISITNPANTEQ